MNRYIITRRRLAAAAGVFALALSPALIGCEDDGIEDAADDAGDAVEEAADEIEDAVDG